MGEIVYLSLGSNLGNRLELLQQAIDAIHKQAGMLLRVSSVYETPPWGFEADTSFLNVCVALETELDPIDLLNVLNDIEHQLGRSRTPGAGYASRTMDIDIIIYGNRIVQTAELEIPHPRYDARKFVLLPLAEIAPDFIDPKTAKPIQYILKACLDESPVTLHQSKLSFNG